MGNVYPSKESWSKVFEFLDGYSGVYTRNKKKLKRFLEGVFWITRTGAQWRELPKKYGKYRSVHKRFDAWSAKGVWQDMHSKFAQDADNEWFMIDSTINRAHPCAVGRKESQEEEGLGRSKGGFTTKIHAMTDALGNAVSFSITGGQRNDITQAPMLIEGFRNTIILADKGYDSDALIEQIKNQECEAVIPPKANRKIQREYDKELYKERHLVEIFFRKLKNFRRIFSRFDKKLRNYLAFTAFAATILWLK